MSTDKLQESAANITALRGNPEGRLVDTVPQDSVQGETASVRGPPIFSERLIGINDLRPMIGNPATSTIYRWIKAGEFPAPLKIGPNRIAFKLSDVQRWIASKSSTLAAA